MTTHFNDVSDYWYGMTKDEVFADAKNRGIVLTKERYQTEIGNMDMNINSCCKVHQDNDTLGGYIVVPQATTGLEFVGYYNCEKCGKKIKVEK